MKRVITLHLMTSIVLFSVFVKANDDQFLLTSCQTLNQNSQSKSAWPCAYYIHGFLAGAVATDAVNSIERSDEANKQSAFVERAYNTRVGSVDSKREATQFMHFCFPDEKSKEGIIDKISKYFPKSIETTEILKATVYNALSTEYPCN